MRYYKVCLCQNIKNGVKSAYNVPNVTGYTFLIQETGNGMMCIANT